MVLEPDHKPFHTQEKVDPYHFTERMNREDRIRNGIKPFVPSGTENALAEQILKYRCHLTITRDRKTKAGDYRQPHGKKGHRISVNGTLNKYAFLITFVHELAHLVCWEEHRNKVNPHGKEWKSTFTNVMQPFLTEDVFPQDILPILKQHMRQPKSATVRDEKLMRALRKYDAVTDKVHLEELESGSEFQLGNKSFIKGGKLRKRFRCEEKGTGRIYLVSGIAEVLPHISMTAE